MSRKRQKLNIPNDAPWIDILRGPAGEPASDAGTVLFIAAIVIVAMLLLAAGCM